MLSKTQCRKLDDSFEAAKGKLVTHPGQGPFVVAENVSRETFDAWDDDRKAAWGLGYDEACHRILMYGDTGGVHACTSGYIFQSIVLEVSRISEQLGRRRLHPFGRSTMYTSRGAKSPDLSFYAAKFASGKSVVIEIAHLNESFAALQHEVEWWHEAGIGLCIGIFIGGHSDIADPNLILLSYMQGCTALVQKRFGHMSGCSAANMSEFMLQIPVRFLVEDSSQEDLVLNKTVLIDLFELQQEIISLLSIER